MAPIRSTLGLRSPVAGKPAVRQPGSSRGVAKADGFEHAPPAATLQRGSTGPAVRALQSQLVKIGFLKQADVATGPGVFGPRTEQGIKSFQLSVGLTPTGVAGPATLTALASGTRFVGLERPRPPVTQPVMARATSSALEAFTEEPTQPIAIPL